MKKLKISYFCKEAELDNEIFFFFQFIFYQLSADPPEWLRRASGIQICNFLGKGPRPISVSQTRTPQKSDEVFPDVWVGRKIYVRKKDFMDIKSFFVFLKQSCLSYAPCVPLHLEPDLQLAVSLVCQRMTWPAQHFWSLDHQPYLEQKSHKSRTKLSLPSE